jgi:8-oxo-dGTP pyrophosphatase MutT (NUDIX family)
MVTAAELRITDPQSVPVRNQDLHLAPVPSERLTADAMRRRLAAPPPWLPAKRGDGLLVEDAVRKNASVLLPLVQRPDGLALLLTLRTSHLRDHAGQISFPGGRAEAHDADAVATALRETEEEIGLARRHVEVIGQLPTYSTVSAYDITPVVALVQPPFELALDAYEVAEAFEVPLTFLMSPANHRWHVVQLGGMQREFLSMPYPRRDGQGEYFIWGATAAMLRNFYCLLTA